MTTLPKRGARVVALATIVTCMCLLGCSGGSGDVSGKVAFNGKALKGGTVTFASADGPSFTGSINEDGTYSVAGVRAGSYKVCVETESLNPKKAGTGSGSGGSGSKGGPPGKGGPPMGKGGPPSGAPIDPLLLAKSGKIKTGPPGGSEEPDDVKEARSKQKDGIAMMIENAKRYIQIPDSYSKPDSTTLTFTAGKGSQTFDIELK